MAADRRLHSLCLDAGVLPVPVLHRRQDQPRRIDHRESSLHATARMDRGGDPHRPARVRQLRLRPRGRALRQHLRQLGQDRRDLHPHQPADRLSHRLRHRAFAAGDAQPAPDGGHPAVLDVVPAPRLRLDGSAGRPGHDQQPADRHRDHRRTDPDALHRLRGLPGDRLHLPAVRGAAALREHGEAGRLAAGGGRGSGREAGQRLPDRDAAVDGAGHHRGLPADVHSRHRGVRRSRPAGRRERPDDRPGALQRVPRQHRLADRIGGGDRAAGAAGGGADDGLPALPGQSTFTLETTFGNLAQL